MCVSVGWCDAWVWILFNLIILQRSNVLSWCLPRHWCHFTLLARWGAWKWIVVRSCAFNFHLHGDHQLITIACIFQLVNCVMFKLAWFKFLIAQSSYCLSQFYLSNGAFIHSKQEWEGLNMSCAWRCFLCFWSKMIYIFMMMIWSQLHVCFSGCDAWIEMR